MLGGRHRIVYDMDKDMVWRWDQVLKTHPNGMRFSVFGEDGDLLATNEYFRYVKWPHPFVDCYGRAPTPAVADHIFH